MPRKKEDMTKDDGRLKFETFRSACFNVDRMRRGLPDGYPGDADLYRLFDDDCEIPWVGLNLGGGDVDGEWDRLAVCSMSSFEIGEPDSKAFLEDDYFIIVVCHFPAGSLARPKNPICEYRRVVAWERKDGKPV
jgi:hypothetical protein